MKQLSTSTATNSSNAPDGRISSTSNESSRPGTRRSNTCTGSPCAGGTGVGPCTGYVFTRSAIYLFLLLVLLPEVEYSFLRSCFGLLVLTCAPECGIR